MFQYFLLPAKARTPSLKEVARILGGEAGSHFRAARFADNGSEPFCPHGGGLGVCDGWFS